MAKPHPRLRAGLHHWAEGERGILLEIIDRIMPTVFSSRVCVRVLLRGGRPGRAVPLFWARFGRGLADDWSAHIVGIAAQIKGTTITS